MQGDPVAAHDRFVNAGIDAVLGLTTLVVIALISVELALLTVGVTLLYLLLRLSVYPALRRRTEEEIVARTNERRS